MLTESLHHISFAVTDLARAREFYEGLLGLESIPRPDFGIAGIWYAAGNAEVHLIQTPGGQAAAPTEDPISPLGNHQAFGIRDYDDILGSTIVRHRCRLLALSSMAIGSTRASGRLISCATIRR